MAKQADARETENVRQALRGDRRAFEKLVATHMRDVYNFAYRMTGNHTDADDVAQQAFVRAYRHLDRFEPGTSFRAWVMAIAANLSRDVHRRRSVRREVALEASSHLGAPTDSRPAARAEQREDEAIVWQALDCLPPEQRAVLVLHAMEDLPLADIARIMDEPEGTIRWRYFQAKKRLRRRLEAWTRSLGLEPE